MHYVLFGDHNAEVCPTSNSRTRDLLLETAPQIPKIAERAGVSILAGPYVNREHMTVVIVEADTGEALDQFLLESRLPQWNRMRVLPSVPLEIGIHDLETMPSLF